MEEQATMRPRAIKNHIARSQLWPPRAIATLLLLICSPSDGQPTKEDEALIDRIRSVGQIYIAGEVELVTKAPVVLPTTGAEVYGQFCHACHQSGLAGAPKKGDLRDWQPRLSQGKAPLYQHALSGFNAMPAKGGCDQCDDQLIIDAVDYLLAALPQ